MNLEGDLGDIGLSHLIQWLCTQRRNVGIELERAGEKGSREKGLLYLASGEIVDAAAGATRGETAVYRLLGWNDGVFKVDAGLRAPGRSIWASWNELLLEGMRQLDEDQHEDRTEDAFVALLSELEQRHVRLRERSRRRSSAAFEGCAEMVNLVAEFWDGLPELDAGRHGLAALVEEVARERPAAHLLPLSGDRLKPLGFRALADSLPEIPGASPLRGVADALLVILGRLLQRVVDRFHSEELREEWSETCRLFVGEVRGTMDDLEI